MPCRWMGCVIIVSLTSTMRTRSPYVSRTGSASENLIAVERPREAFHVAGEVQLDGAARLAAIRIVEHAPEVAVGEDAPPVVAQAEARVVQLRRRRHRLHVHERVAGLAGRVRQGADMSCRRVHQVRASCGPRADRARASQEASCDRRAGPRQRAARRPCCGRCDPSRRVPCRPSSAPGAGRARAPRACRPSRTASVPAA